MSNFLGDVGRQIQKKALDQDKGSDEQIAKLERRSKAQLASLEDHFRIVVLQVMSELTNNGWKPVVFWGVRTPEQQEKLHDKGVGAKKSLHVHETQKIVHRAGWSYVQTGEAADIVDARYLWTGPAEDLNFRFWVELGEAAERRGLEWGGRWTNRDVAHVQCAHYEPIIKSKKGKRDDTPYQAVPNRTVVA
ncbi:hypothetical protein GAY33_16625 [Azospirillum brasilense]|uniref:M15 family metallopeptidase n=1 Tax=Azospirillum argentinense TaxID=2970906 RepID=UPI00190EFE14|nr:M15 family metallopeptidase [Azospirillum argentinense]MBK3800835.1 hypothetical protein [Azospirillum argentinense]